MKMLRDGLENATDEARRAMARKTIDLMEILFAQDGARARQVAQVSVPLHEPSPHLPMHLPQSWGQTMHDSDCWGLQ